MQNLLYTELSVSRTLMELRSWNFSYIGIGKYLGEWGVSIFSARRRPGASGAQDFLALMQIWDPHIIFETTGARKLNLKTQLNVVKYSLRVE